MRAPSSSVERPVEPVDFGTVESAQKHLAQASEELSSMVEDISAARTVKEFSGDRMKRALAVSVREFLKDHSAAAADTLGKASPLYGEALDTLSAQYEEAERVIAKWTATQARFDASRSILSSLRAIAGNL